MSDVFVSYKAEDRARVAPLVQALEAEGLERLVGHANRGGLGMAAGHPATARSRRAA